MRQTVTRILGLTVNIEIVETSQTDSSGGILYYVAAIYVQVRGADRRLVRKSRLPGAAMQLKNDIEKHGLQVFRNIAP